MVCLCVTTSLRIHFVASVYISSKVLDPDKCSFCTIFDVSEIQEAYEYSFLTIRPHLLAVSQHGQMLCADVEISRSCSLEHSPSLPLGWWGGGGVRHLGGASRVPGFKTNKYTIAELLAIKSLVLRVLECCLVWGLMQRAWTVCPLTFLRRIVRVP